jgi:hypothetical protein
MKHLFYPFLALIFSLNSYAQILPAKALDSKLDGKLRELSDSYQLNKRLDSASVKSKLINVDKNTGRVLVNAIAETDVASLTAELTQAGAEIVSSYGRIVTCWVAVAALPAIEKLATARMVQPVYRPRRRTGPVNSQGDAAQRSDIARTQFGVNGQGVKVGVLSDSYNALAGAPASVTVGELPGVGNPNGFTTAVTNLLDYTDSDASDEGRGMLEIVHDVAPGAQLYFRTAFISPTDFANGIQELANAGCKVIIDDIGYFDQPFFQDGVIAQSVDNVKANNGVTYFSAAGNSADLSYENAYLASTFKPLSYTSATAHNFGTVGSPVYFLPIQIPANSSTDLSFQWDDPFFSVSGGTGARGDLDIYLLKTIPSSFPINSDPTTSSVVVARKEANNIGKDALEILSYDNTTSSSKTYYVLITKYAGTNPTRLKLVENTDGFFPASASSIVGINGSTCYGHPNAAGAIAAGAAPFNKTPAYGVNPPEIERFSSKGGTPIYFSTTGVRLTTPVTRKKPDVTAPDGGNTSFFVNDSSIDADNIPNFFGTSAAAPHAGAVAALMLQAKPMLTPNDAKTALIASCVDMDDPTTAGFDIGFDFFTGYGLIRADLAVQSVLPPAVACISLGSGSWNSIGTWSCGFIPLVTTPVTINASHVVTINGFTAKAKKVQYAGSGKIQFLNSGKLSFVP